MSNADTASNINNQDIKISKSELQNKRASKTHSFTYQFNSNYISSFPFFNSIQSNTTPKKIDQDLTDLNHLPLSTSSPIDLASKCINAQIERDNSTPTLYEILSIYMIDNYNFNPKQNSSPFTRFEKVDFFGIPEKLLDDNNDSLVTNMGIFPQIKRSWFSIDSKLYIWNYNASLTDQEFDVIDDFNGTILTCALVKPKPNVFVESVTNLLVVATSKEIKLLALEFNPASKKLEISDTKMAVSSHGLIVNKIAFFEETNDIFFCGAGSKDALWKLNYSNSTEWFSKSITKECLTNSSFSSTLPNIPVLNWLNSETSFNGNTESVIDLKIDQSRKIIYTLSSKSVIKCYKLQVKNGQTLVGQPIVKRISNLLKELSTTAINIGSPLLRSKLKIINVHPVSKSENPNLFLVAVASNGCRFFINGSTSYGDRITLTTNFVKFPPMDLKLYQTIEERKEKLINQNQSFNNTMPDLKAQQPLSLQAYQPYRNTGYNYSATSKQENTSDKSITKSSSNSLVSAEELKLNQEKSELLNNTLNTLIISPGIFIGYSKEIGLYTSTPDYGIFKKSSQYVEDFEIVDKFSNVFEIVQISSSFNATNKPKGYVNEFASQYTSEPLEFAVLTNVGILIYRYRTPDLILEDSLTDSVFKKYANKYGSDEACSTSLYLACKYDKSESFRNIATKFFISGGQNSKLDKSLSAIIDNVEPSDRFFAVLILLSRLLRRIWNKEVFKLRKEIKFDNMGYIESKSLKNIQTDKQLILDGLNIEKKELEYLLCSILIIIKFFEENRSIIPGLSKDLSNQNESASWQEKATEVCIQAERICFDSIYKYLNIVKEGLSFLTILVEDDDDESDKPNKNFNGIISFLPIQLQADLSCVTFSDFFTKSDTNVSKLIKELLSCVISKSISQGNSVELVANTLQEKCGYFCSTDDVLIFKAIESLKKAKDYSDFKGEELKVKYLENSINLLKQSSDSLSEETIIDCVNSILELGFYSNAVELLLDIANTPEQVKLSLQYQNELQLSMAIDPLKKNSFLRKLKLYNIIFQILIAVDKKALSSLEQTADATVIGNNETSKLNPSIYVDGNGQLVTYYSQVRDECYNICLNYRDQMFHFEFYKWFVDNGIGEKLLYIDTPYILDFLREKSFNDLEMSKLLWLYYSKKGDYYEAANQLYYLALSRFHIKLVDRIQFLSIANSFIQGIETQYMKQDILSLASKISDLISVSYLQDELLQSILQDARVGDLGKNIANKELDNEILTVNELYNDYIDPLGYYELALNCFKLSDYRNNEDVLSKWESLFDKWYVEYKQIPNFENELFYSSLCNKFVIVAGRLKDVDNLFPIINLLNLMFTNIYTRVNKKHKIEPGIVVNAFIKSGISYSRLYHNLRKLIESITYELFEGYSEVANAEIKYLLNAWYKNDKKLREVISGDAIRSIGKFDLNNDPIDKYIRKSGNPL
ncbi:hypothetical protein C6P42_002927 [Pichia californica]|nr:hypothetical protein C6P42_002927 [[Candida] californica]